MDQTQLPDGFADVVFDELNPQMSCMDIESVGRRFGGRVCFRADMDRQYVLPFGTPADVTALVNRLYCAFGTKNGGYIGYGQINSDVPIENVEAMLMAFSGLRYQVGDATIPK